MNYKVVKDFLHPDMCNKIYSIMTSNNFPWHYIDSIATDEDNKRFYFTHMLILDSMINSSFHPSIHIPLEEKIDHKTILRSKCNLFVKENENFHSEKHVDHEFKHKVCLYYVNTNNGYTLLDNKIKVDSIANTALFFDGEIPHQAVSQTDTKVRLNINITYQV